MEQSPVSQVCEEAGVKPTQFYQWQKQFFENGAAAFAQERKVDPARERLALLEAKLRRKDEVLGELMEEYVALKFLPCPSVLSVVANARITGRPRCVNRIMNLALNPIVA